MQGDNHQGWEAVPPAWGEATPSECFASPYLDPLVVARGDDTLALAFVRSIGASLRVEHLFPRDRETAGAALAAIPGERIEVSLGSPSPAGLDGRLRAAGFRVVLDQVSYRADLAGAPLSPPRPRPLTFRRYSEVGRAGMLTALEAIWVDSPGPTGQGPRDELDGFLSSAEEHRARDSSTELWRLAYHRGELAGAYLGHLIDGEPLAGALLYFGLVPAARGKGLGRAMHREALHLLRAAGASEYVDSVARGNLAMERIIATAGGVATGSSKLYVLDRRRRRAGHAARAKARGTRLALGRHESLLRKVPVTPRG